MLEHDFIVRQIRKMVSVLLRVAGLKKAGQDQQALATIDESIGELHNLSLSIIRSTDIPTLLGLMSPGGEPDVMGCVSLGTMLYERAELLLAMGDTDDAVKDRRRAKALLQLARAHDAVGEFEEYTRLVDEMD
jgi:hypothetical protein